MRHWRSIQMIATRLALMTHQFWECFSFDDNLYHFNFFLAVQRKIKTFIVWNKYKYFFFQFVMTRTIVGNVDKWCESKKNREKILYTMRQHQQALNVRIVVVLVAAHLYSGNKNNTMILNGHRLWQCDDFIKTGSRSWHLVPSNVLLLV